MNNKQEIQQLLDNADENQLCIKHDGENTHFDDIMYSLEQCQKEPTLHDKLIEYGFYNNCPYYKLEIMDKSEYPECDVISININTNLKDVDLIHYKDRDSTLLNSLRYDTHEQVFDAIKLFEKWSQE